MQMPLVRAEVGEPEIKENMFKLSGSPFGDNIFIDILFGIFVVIQFIVDFFHKIVLTCCLRQSHKEGYRLEGSYGNLIGAFYHY